MVIFLIYLISFLLFLVLVFDDGFLKFSTLITFPFFFITDHCLMRTKSILTRFDPLSLHFYSSKKFFYIQG